MNITFDILRKEGNTHIIALATSAQHYLLAIFTKRWAATVVIGNLFLFVIISRVARPSELGEAFMFVIQRGIKQSIKVNTKFQWI
jgi:hypothetical protein